tara:strand:+ start:2148 stop:4022 length:1875 start_codon:yes stop_codon:yes gene_type:complete
MLKTSYHAFIHKQAAERCTPVTPFGKSVADSLYEAAMAAVRDKSNGRAHMQVVSAPTGAGKSSYAAAFAASLISSDSVATVLFVVETIDQAEEVFRTVSKLISEPNEVAVWTSAHDADSADEEIVARGFVPAKHRFRREDLRCHRVAVVTHRFFMGRSSNKAKETKWGPRTVTFVDEHPDMVGIYEVSPGDVFTVREKIAKADPFDSRVVLLTQVGEKLEVEYTATKEGRASYEPMSFPVKLADAFADADTTHAGEWCKLIGLRFDLYSTVAKFLRAADDGCVFQANRQEGGKASFVAYQLEMHPVPGMVLLDATADLSGVIPVVDFMTSAEVPSVDYRSLEVIHVEPETKKLISRVIRMKETAEPYADWIKRTILDHTEPGEEALVVTHKSLLDHGYLGEAKQEARDWKGRIVHLSHWGTGIGSNRWRDVSAVFLFGEFYRPKRADVATTLGLQSEPVSLSELRMANGRSLKGPYEAIQEGHLLRWLKQLAMRGRARNIDAEGVCGQMRLVLSGNRQRLLRNFGRLFPGAPAPRLVSHRTKAGRGHSKHEALVGRLAAWARDEVPGEKLWAQEVANDVGIDWKAEGRRLVRHPHVVEAMGVFQIAYEAGRGTGDKSRFYKIAA